MYYKKSILKYSSDEIIPRSLNSLSRKQYDDKVDRENSLLAERLITKKSCLNFQTMENDYNFHLYLKNHLLTKIKWA